MLIGTWFGAGYLGPAGRVVVLVATLPLALVMSAWLPRLALVAVAALIVLASVRPAQRTARDARPAIVGGTAAALCLALSPARPGVVETVTAVMAVSVLVLARPSWLRAIDRTATVAVGDAVTGITTAALVALERYLHAP